MSSDLPPTRQRILDAAWRLLESGAATRMADIAAAAAISRQALYLHFPNRADLLVATVRHIDAVKDIDGRLAASRGATTGEARLDAFVAAWCGYIPEIGGVGRALLAMQDDAAAAAAWADRMEAVHHGCRAAVAALARDGVLSPDLSEAAASDLLWSLLSVETWQALVERRGWSQAAYVAAMQRATRRMLHAGDATPGPVDGP